MQAFKVWDDGVEETDAKDIEDNCVRDAAEAYATKVYNKEPFNTLEVLVRDDTGQVWEVTVDAEVEMSFYAGKPTKVKDDELTKVESP